MPQIEWNQLIKIRSKQVRRRNTGTYLKNIKPRPCTFRMNKNHRYTQIHINNSNT